MEATPQIAVIGLGNVLLGDDGFGPCVVEQLRAQWALPDSVTLIDGGTPGLGLVTLLAGCDVAVLVDCIAAPGAPGELRCYDGEELHALPVKPRVSPHDPAVQEALAITQFVGHGPDRVLLIGVIPQSLRLATDLSAPVLSAVPRAVTLAVEALAKAGAPAVRRDTPHPPDPWWSIRSRDNGSAHQSGTCSRQ
jgi:hydrogenase maturation protease